MSDDHEIPQLMHRYAFALDARRWDLFDSVFTRDVVADYGFNTWPDRETWKRDFEDLHASLDATQHVMSNISWTLQPDTGFALTYGVSHLIRRGADGGEMLMGGCWYDDELTRTIGGWRISKRTCRLVWQSGNPAVVALSADGPGPELSSLGDASKQGAVAFLASLA